MSLKKEPVKEDTSSISPELLKQFQNNFSAAPLTESAEYIPEESVKEKKVSDKKPNYKNIFNVHLGTGDKARLKTFCAAREVPINTFILFAIEHLIDEVEEGKCTVSKSGIRTIKKEG